MEKAKQFTQSITWILVAVIVICTGLLLGAIYYLTGLTQSVDSLWDIGKLQFWVAALVTRWIFAAVWGFGDDYLVAWLHKKNWFWFKEPEPEESWQRQERLKREASIDKSGVYLLYVTMLFCLAFFGFFIAELVIRIPFDILPPYVPPPN